MSPAERDRQAVAMWTSGRYGQTEIAEVLDVSQATVRRTLHAFGVLNHPRAMQGRRWRHARAARATGNLKRPPGRPKVWPDCPPHLRDDYHQLRLSGFSAPEARAMLEV